MHVYRTTALLVIQFLLLNGSFQIYDTGFNFEPEEDLGGRGCWGHPTPVPLFLAKFRLMFNIKYLH